MGYFGIAGLICAVCSTAIVFATTAGYRINRYCFPGWVFAVNTFAGLGIVFGGFFFFVNGALEASCQARWIDYTPSYGILQGCILLVDGRHVPEDVYVEIDRSREFGVTVK